VIQVCFVSGDNLVYRKNNGSWQSAVTVATGSGYMSPMIAADTGNNPAIVPLGPWVKNGYHILSKWNGSAWASPKLIGYGQYANVAIDANNKAHIVWSFKKDNT